jgi:hypothetical protein
MPVRGHSWDYWKEKLMKEQGYDEETANKIIGSWEQEDKKKSEGEFISSLGEEEIAVEAEYQGKKVTLNKPMRNSDGKSKFKVYVQDGDKVKKVTFGDPNMEIKRDSDERRKSFRARHNCADKKDKTTAGYWSCKMWQKGKSVGAMTGGEADPCWDGYKQFGMKGDPPVPNCIPSKESEIEFDPKELEMGKKVELEHTDDENEAEKIAKDHLKEVPDYYTKLAKYVEDGREAIEFEGETYISLGENEKTGDNDLELDGKVYAKATNLSTKGKPDDEDSLSTKESIGEGFIKDMGLRKEDLPRYNKESLVNIWRDANAYYQNPDNTWEEEDAEFYTALGELLVSKQNESYSNEEGIASVTGPPAGTEPTVIEEEALADTNVGGDLGKELGDSVVESHDPILLNDNYLAFENVLYRPVYAGENIDINDDSILIYENKYYTSEGTGNCPMCKGAGKVTVERLGLKECPKCEGSGDIQEKPEIPQEQPQMQPPQLQESKSNEEFKEEDRNRDSDGKWISKGGGSSNKKTTQFYNPIDELGSTVMDQIESGDKNGVLRQWIKDQSDNKEQKSKIDMVKKELNKRGISTESYTSESKNTFDYFDSKEIEDEDIMVCNLCGKEFNEIEFGVEDAKDHLYNEHGIVNHYESKASESCGCKVKAFEASVSGYKQFINKEIQVLKKRAKAGEAVGLMYGLPTVRKNGRKIKGTLAYAGVSLNDRIYLPEELAKGHGKTLPLLLNHSSTAGAEEELDRLNDEMRNALETETDYKVGEVTLTWDPKKLTLFYEGVVENEFFQKEIDDMNMAVSLGIYYDSDSPKVCDEECYTLIKGAEFREVSLVYHAGFPIATIEAVESQLKRNSRKSIIEENEIKSISPSDNGYIPPPVELDEAVSEEEEDPLPQGGSIDVEEKPMVVESLYTPNSFSIRGVSGMTISNSNGVERYVFDPTQNYSTNTIHFSVVGEGATIFGEQLQPKMATSDNITKEIESKPDIEIKDSDEDILKKN